jgi:hypothetical protein
MIIKKFESFNSDLYEESDLDWYLSHKRMGMSDDEYYKLKDYFTKLGTIQFLPYYSPTKHNYDASSFFSITAKFTSFVKAEVMKMEDDWWFIRYSNDLNGNVKCYKCDTIQGVFDLFNKQKVVKD